MLWVGCNPATLEMITIQLLVRFHETEFETIEEKTWRDSKTVMFLLRDEKWALFFFSKLSYCITTRVQHSHHCHHHHHHHDDQYHCH